MTIHRLLAWTTTMYVVEQMIVYDDDDIIVGSSASKQVPPYVSPSMSAFDLDNRLLKLLTTNEIGKVDYHQSLIETGVALVQVTNGVISRGDKTKTR
jgi:hypothetical protein